MRVTENEKDLKKDLKVPEAKLGQWVEDGARKDTDERVRLWSGDVARGRKCQTILVLV